MRVVVGGRFDYMRVAWKHAVEHNGIIYFENETQRKRSIYERLRNRVFYYGEKLNLFSAPNISLHNRLENLREYFDLDKLSKNEHIVFVLYEMNFLSTDIENIKFLKQYYPKAKFVLFITNTIGSVREECTKILLDNRELYDLIYTFNYHDAQTYQLRLFAGGAFPYDPVVLKEDEKYASDVFWVGKNKGRYQKLNDLSRNMKLRGLSTTFIVTDESVQKSSEDVIVSAELLPYNESLKYICNTKCILDLENNGVGTLRYTEMIAYKRKMLTNNMHAKKMMLYNDKQVIFFSNEEDIAVELIQGELTDAIDPKLVSTEMFLKEVFQLLGI